MPPICAAARANTTVVEARPLGLDGLFELRPSRSFDARGFFSEVWRDDWLEELGLDVRFVQDNHSRSISRGVLRGLHFQNPPAAQDKLVRVARGSIFDVAVDVRRASPTFGRWAGLVISSSEWNQLLIPGGFAHGFVALEDETDVIYKVSGTYSPAQERSVRFDDPALAIEWPVEPSAIVTSEKDRSAPLLADLETDF
jgi:dTDP-4-dehydrorhamnose 3,5-epimerase